MKTTTEFNWLTALEQAIEREPSIDKAAALHDRANEWPTCACGELCKALPRTSNGSPKDCELYDLGHSFCNSIGAGSWRAALSTFHQIEARTALLLSQAQAKKGEGE